MNKLGMAFFVSSILAAVSTLCAATIRVRILDGRNGKPIANERAQIWINGRTGNAHELTTGRDGVATLEIPAGASLDIESNLFRDCRPFEKRVPRPTYSTDEIVSSGFAAGNGCGKLSSEARRGELLFFVRPRHWWEGMRQ